MTRASGRNGPRTCLLTWAFAGREHGPRLIMCSDQGAPIKTKAVKVSLLPDTGPGKAFAQASRFRDDLFDCLTARGDELFELTDALLCADGPVTSPVDLTLTAEHRRGHGAMYDALNSGNVDVPRLRQVLAGLPHPGDKWVRHIVAQLNSIESTLDLIATA